MKMANKKSKLEKETERQIIFSRGLPILLTKYVGETSKRFGDDSPESCSFNYKSVNINKGDIKYNLLFGSSGLDILGNGELDYVGVKFPINGFVSIQQATEKEKTRYREAYQKSKFYKEKK